MLNPVQIAYKRVMFLFNLNLACQEKDVGTDMSEARANINPKVSRK
jgi:hypothetical protein